MKRLLLIPLVFFLACEDKKNDTLPLDCAGVEGGDSPDTDNDGICDWNDGDSYETVMIGEQEWMAKNLSVTHYRNGDAIPNVTNNDNWVSLTTGAYCNFNNKTNNSNIFGKLYNWYAVNDSRNIAPDGWHVPTDDEIKELEIYLGMSPEEADNTGHRGTNEGSKLAGWSNLWAGIELSILTEDSEFGVSGFNAVPSGFRFSGDGFYYDMTDFTGFWSSTEYSSSKAWYRSLSYDLSGVFRSDYSKNYGFSIRCLKD